MEEEGVDIENPKIQQIDFENDISTKYVKIFQEQDGDDVVVIQYMISGAYYWAIANIEDCPSNEWSLEQTKLWLNDNCKNYLSNNGEESSPDFIPTTILTHY